MSDESADWFTAGEAAAVIKAAGATDELAGTGSGLTRWIKRQAAADPDGFGAALRTLSRVRPGQTGGGGTEYHWALFDTYDTKRATSALRAEVDARRQLGELAEIMASARVADLRWELIPRRPGELVFSPEETRLMWQWLGVNVVGDRAPEALTRKVRRAGVVVNNDHYRHPSLKSFEGEVVAVAVLRVDGKNFAFAWKCCATRKVISHWGRDGFICGVAADERYKMSPAELLMFLETMELAESIGEVERKAIRERYAYDRFGPNVPGWTSNEDYVQDLELRVRLLRLLQARGPRDV